jgi:penicillin-binding protein 1A
MVGMENIVETARQAGITSRLDPNLSLTLGSSAVSPLDMAGAYATFARAGVHITPTVLRKIENNRGQVIEIFEPKVDKVFPVDPVARLVSILQDVVLSGTGTAAKLKDRPVAGKTGTADDGKDIWFCGFTPDLVTVVWAGNDENKPIKGSAVTGGTVMAPMWKQFMTTYYEKRPTPAGSFVTAMPLPAEEKIKTSGDASRVSGDKPDDTTDSDSQNSDSAEAPVTDPEAAPTTETTTEAAPTPTAPVDPLLAPQTAPAVEKAPPPAAPTPGATIAPTTETTPPPGGAKSEQAVPEL